MITIPTNCPSCNSVLVRKGPNLYCENTSCGEVEAKVLHHFARTLKIKGLGPDKIKRMGFTKIMDIYRTHSSRYCEVLGIPTGTKIFREIEESKKLTMTEVIPALSIPQVSVVAAKKISAAYNEMQELVGCDKLSKVIGVAAAAKLQKWLSNNEETWGCLPQTKKFRDIKIYHKTVCLTGRLKSFRTKAEATKKLNEHGYNVVETVSNKVDYLINESGRESAKTKRAEEIGIVIITNIEDLLKNE